VVDLVQQLHRDHSDIARLLKLLTDELDVARVEEEPDYSRMLLVMKYMTHYPDVVHHPKEDVLFERLIDRAPSIRIALQTLTAEHRMLAEKGLEFFDILHAAAHEYVVERVSLETRGHDYISTLYRHMRFEETEVFPVARERLSRRDWRTIDSRVESLRDPLFGKQVDDQYRSLYELIFKQ